MVKNAGMTTRNCQDSSGLAGIRIMNGNGLVLVSIIANNALS